MTKSLIEYHRQFYTYEEQLLLAEAGRRRDWVRANEIILAATMRSMCIPAWMFEGEQSYNYSSARIDSYH